MKGVILNMFKYLLILLTLCIIHQAECKSQKKTREETPIEKEGYTASHEELMSKMKDIFRMFTTVWGTRNRLLRHDEETESHQDSNKEAHDGLDHPEAEKNEGQDSIPIKEKRNCSHIPPMTCEVLDTEPTRGCCRDTDNQCHRAHLGKCRFAWQNGSSACDYLDWNYCSHDNTKCFCCVKCRGRPGSDCELSNGKCMKECGIYGYERNTNCGSKRCKCCHGCLNIHCEEHAKGAKCVSNITYCTSGFYPMYGGCSEDCVCCVPCPAEEGCLEVGGYPERLNLTCKEDYEEDFTIGEGICKCCIPKPELRGRECKLLEMDMDHEDHDKLKLRHEDHVEDGHEERFDFCTSVGCPPHYFQHNNGCSLPAPFCFHCSVGWDYCAPIDCEGGYCTKLDMCVYEGYFLSYYGCISSDDVPCNCCLPECARVEGDKAWIRKLKNMH